MSRPNLPVAAHRYPPPMSPMPPQQPPPRGGGGFGRQLIGMVAWGAGISFAFAGISYLFGGRRSQEVHHAAPQHQAPRRSAPNPAINRPIVNCTIEEEVLQQCLRSGGQCSLYQSRVDECHRRESEGQL